MAVLMSKASKLMYAVAKAINGPQYAETYDLNGERDQAWNAIDVRTKRERLQQARAAIAQFESGVTDAIGLTRPVETKDEM
jgi:hypothetical protein